MKGFYSKTNKYYTLGIMVKAKKMVDALSAAKWLMSNAFARWRWRRMWITILTL